MPNDEAYVRAHKGTIRTSPDPAHGPMEHRDVDRRLHQESFPSYWQAPRAKGFAINSGCFQQH